MAHDHMIEILDLDAEVLDAHLGDLIDWVAREAADRPRVLDLGAGAGAGCLTLARRLPGSVVTAVDVSPQMLARVRDRAGASGLGERIRTVEADLDQPWPDFGPTDVIWAAASMHHMADPAAALAAAFDTLRPGGLLLIAERESFPRFLDGALDEDVERRAHAASAKHRHEAGLHMGEDWGERMSHAGFTSVSRRHFDIDLRPPLPAAAVRYARACLSQTRHGLEDRLPPSDLAALDKILAGLDSRDDLSVRTERTAWLARR